MINSGKSRGSSEPIGYGITFPFSVVYGLLANIRQVKPFSKIEILAPNSNQRGLNYQCRTMKYLHLCSPFCCKIWIVLMDIFEHLVYDVLFSLSMKSLVAWVEEMLYTISSPQFQKDIYWIDANTLCCVLYAKDSKFGRSLIFAHTNSVIFQQRYEVYAIIPNIKLRKLSITTTLMQLSAE